MSGREIATRFLPVPTTVSRQLAAAMAQPLDACLELVLRAPTNRVHWPAYVAKFAEGADDRITQFLERYPAKIETSVINGVTVHKIGPHSLSAKNAKRLLVHLHGGAFVVGGGRPGLAEAILAAHHTGTTVLSIDYRLAPDHPFPAALDDALAVWRDLTSRIDPRLLAIFGTSAGGGLALSLGLAAKAASLPLPAAFAPSTPWSELAENGDSYFVNRFVDAAAPTYEGLLAASAKFYAGGRDMSDPLLSPVNGDFSGFPPTLLFSGTRDLFLSNTVRVHRKMRQAGVDAQLHIFEGLSHGNLIALDDSPEAIDAMSELNRFLDSCLD